MTKKQIAKIIRKRLEKTRDCDFKRDWIPIGWAVVKIDTFVEEVADQIAESCG